MERMTVAEAAKIMQVSQQYIRLGLQRGVFPFGNAVKTSSRWTYWISRLKFEKYMKGEGV